MSSADAEPLGVGANPGLPVGRPGESRDPRTPRALIATLAPGLLLATVVSLAATFVSQQSGGAPLVYALVFGVALHWAAQDPRGHAGLAWAAGPLLRLGVGLLGVRLSVQHVADLGLAPVLLMALAMASTIGLGLLGARWLKLPWTLGLLAGGANAICGASATLALASVLPRHDPQLARQTAVVAACATAISTLAMLLYPPIAHALGLDAVQAGLFLGGSIQDVAQVVAAGYAHSAAAGDTAITLKLARVALLGPIVAAVAMVVRWQAVRHAGSAPAGRIVWVPAFVWLFFGLLALNSTGWVGADVQHGLTQASQACVTVAMAALGIRLSLHELLKAGWRPFLLLGGLAAWIAAFMACGAGFLTR